MSPAVVAAVDAARVLAERDRVLAAREFNPEPDWRTRLFEWFIAPLASVLPIGLRAVGLILLFTALGLALVWLLRRHRPGTPAAAGKGVPLARQSGFAGLRADARRALAEGQLAEAVKLAWLAALALLDQAGLSAARAARADWEHVAAARRQRPDLVAPLADLALEFQRTRFGHAALDRAQADRCLGLLGVLQAGLQENLQENLREGLHG